MGRGWPGVLERIDREEPVIARLDAPGTDGIPLESLQSTGARLIAIVPDDSDEALLSAAAAGAWAAVSESEAHPILASSDAQVIQGHAAAGLMVVRASVSSVRAVRRAIKHLPADKLLFSFLNESRTANNIDYYDYYYNEGDHLDRVTSTEAESDELDVDRS